MDLTASARICAVLLPLPLVLSACGSGDPARVTADSAKTFDAVAAHEKLYFNGTEPFWGGEVLNGRLTYTTPDDSAGQIIEVKRFAGLNGLGFSGELGGSAFDMAVTTGECSDGMSDRSYPFTVTLRIGDGTRNGCGWTDAMSFTGQKNP
ncbi:MAG: hypothetical protein WAT93_08990 [Pontixanthobacter sp.]